MPSANGVPKKPAAWWTASGELADGTKVDGPVALRNAILNRRQQFVETLTEKLLTYALGRGLEYYDMPVVRSIVGEAADKDYRFSAIVLGTVRSVPFRVKIVEPQLSASTPRQGGRLP